MSGWRLVWPSEDWMARASPLGPRLSTADWLMSTDGWLFVPHFPHVEGWSDTQFLLGTVIQHIRLQNRVWHKHGIKRALDCADDYRYHLPSLYCPNLWHSGVSKLGKHSWFISLIEPAGPSTPILLQLVETAHSSGFSQCGQSWDATVQCGLEGTLLPGHLLHKAAQRFLLSAWAHLSTFQQLCFHSLCRGQGGWQGWEDTLGQGHSAGQVPGWRAAEREVAGHGGDVGRVAGTRAGLPTSHLNGAAVTSRGGLRLLGRRADWGAVFQCPWHVKRREWDLQNGVKPLTSPGPGRHSFQKNQKGHSSFPHIFLKTQLVISQMLHTAAAKLERARKRPWIAVRIW